jgi:hypothetical protein
MLMYRFLWIAALLALLLGGCTPVQAPAGSTTGPAAETPADTPVAGAPDAALNEITFAASEYRFEGPETVPAGWTRVTLDNQGELAHDIQFFKVEEGKTLDDVMAALQAEGPPEWAQFYGSASAQAGASHWFAANLTPGNYVYLSFGEAENAPPDAAQGMIGTLNVTEAAGAVPEDAPIEEDATIELVDYQFVVDGTLAAGEQVLRVRNTGAELHEVVFFKLKEGKTIDDFLAMMEQEMAGEPMPEEGEAPAQDESAQDDDAGGDDAGGDDAASAEEGAAGEEDVPGEFAGGAFLSPGLVSYTTVDLKPGDYVLVCFIPSPKFDMQPHAMLGMIQQVTVE